MGCDGHTHAPAQKNYTSFIPYPFVVKQCSTNWHGHGRGYEWHSSVCVHVRTGSVRGRPAGARHHQDSRGHPHAGADGVSNRRTEVIFGRGDLGPWCLSPLGAS